MEVLPNFITDKLRSATHHQFFLMYQISKKQHSWATWLQNTFNLNIAFAVTGFYNPTLSKAQISLYVQGKDGAAIH